MINIKCYVLDLYLCVTGFTFCRVMCPLAYVLVGRDVGDWGKDGSISVVACVRSLRYFGAHEGGDTAFSLLYHTQTKPFIQTLVKQRYPDTRSSVNVHA